ncbi:phosphoserine phosphatase SerB [Alphaproteobacteria bacterium KMM 3653]|uniref:Phosphoserine phosphatase n=1 Tax=Harenicola maris TaxID=2841044 RepID=A0AAP2CTR0_9RHOB|nr:phosphoserine phosphatase SerB [Harenicola maris]
MHTVTLMSDPANPALEPAAAEALRNAWGGSDLIWLQPDVAAQFAVAERPDNVESVWADMQGLGIDLVCLPGKPRVFSLLLADMDSTMIGQECIDELGAEAGVAEAVAGITRRAMNGEIGFQESAVERVALLKGLDTGVISHVLATRITHRPGGKTLVATMRAKGAYSALISGGFTAFSGVVAKDLGFDAHRANDLIEEGGKLTGEIARPILGRQAKVEAMDAFCAELGITHADVIAVGDGANDLAMLGTAGLGVAAHAKPAVQEAVEARINHCDLTGLLFLQGLSADEFAT